MNLNKATQLLPIGTVIIIGLGVIKTSVYYDHFSVDIMSYLTTSEVLTLFLNDYDSLFVLLLIGLIHFIISDHFIEEVEKNFGSQLMENLMRKHKWKYFWFFLILLTVLFILIKSSIIYLENWNIYLGAFFFVQMITFLFTKKTGTDFFAFKKLALFLCTVVIIGIIPMLSLKEVQKVERNKVQNVRLFSDKEEINTRVDKKYLGKAGEYFFFLDTKNHKTEAIKENEVRKVIFWK